MSREKTTYPIQIMVVIKVYLFRDILDFVETGQRAVLQEIGQKTDTNVKMVRYPHGKKQEGYIEIQGPYEMAHRARILFQELEKEIYKECNQIRTQS